MGAGKSEVGVRARAAILAILAILAVLAMLAALAACVRHGSTTETKPVTADLGQYRTCTLVLESTELGPDGDAFVAYLEGRLREAGVLDPLDTWHTSDADLVLEMGAQVESERTTESRVRVGVSLVERRSKDVLGAFDVRGRATPESGASPSDTAIRETGGSTRRVALHHAADEIVDYLRSKRQSGAREIARAPASAGGWTSRAGVQEEEATSKGPEVPPHAVVCQSRCDAPSSSSLGERELSDITSRVDGALRALHACLERVGASKVEPAVILRFGGDGRFAGMRVDMGGYEDLLCVDPVRARPPIVRVAREAMMRCVFHCS